MVRSGSCLGGHGRLVRTSPTARIRRAAPPKTPPFGPPLVCAKLLDELDPDGLRPRGRVLAGGDRTRGHVVHEPALEAAEEAGSGIRRGYRRAARRVVAIVAL